MRLREKPCTEREKVGNTKRRQKKEVILHPYIEIKVNGGEGREINSVQLSCIHKQKKHGEQRGGAREV